MSLYATYKQKINLKTVDLLIERTWIYFLTLLSFFYRRHLFQLSRAQFVVLRNIGQRLSATFGSNKCNNTQSKSKNIRHSSFLWFQKDGKKIVGKIQLLFFFKIVNEHMIYEVLQFSFIVIIVFCYEMNKT